LESRGTRLVMARYDKELGLAFVGTVKHTGLPASLLVAASDTLPGRGIVLIRGVGLYLTLKVLFNSGT
jgi:hypothetical protein